MNHVDSRKRLPQKNGSTKLWSLPSLYRGIYNRVAQKVGCDPSYVSRVARGERTSIPVSKVLQAEIQQTLALVNVYCGKSLSEPSTKLKGAVGQKAGGPARVGISTAP